MSSTDAIYIVAILAFLGGNLWQAAAHHRFVRRSAEVLALVVAQRDAAYAGQGRDYGQALWEDWRRHYKSDDILVPDVLSAAKVNQLPIDLL